MTESGGGKKRLGFMDSPAGPAETKALWADFDKAVAGEDQPEDSLGDIYIPV